MLMKTDELGIPRFSNKDLLDMIYTGHIDKCHVVLCDPNDDIEKFNQHAKENGIETLKKYVPLDVDKNTFDGVCQSEWFMPEKYKTLDIENYVIGKCRNPEEIQRVEEEFRAFEKRDMLNLLRYMVYLVDHMRENNIVWGVGRGSSTASYVLFLIGIHKINSIQFGLDWREFLR
jgi:DNA polymerase III alpha subunit|tara:strand:+ start:6905 stop:7426 length:522 start_codon:yes stop_codon:yes gene_type:complete